MTRNDRFPRFLVKTLLWFVSLFTIDTACTLWLWHEPYLLGRTVGCNFFVALVFALLDHYFDPFARGKRNSK